MFALQEQDLTLEEPDFPTPVRKELESTFWLVDPRLHRTTRDNSQKMRRPKMTSGIVRLGSRYRRTTCLCGFLDSRGRYGAPNHQAKEEERYYFLFNKQVFPLTTRRVLICPLLWRRRRR